MEKLKNYDKVTGSVGFDPRESMTSPIDEKSPLERQHHTTAYVEEGRSLLLQQAAIGGGIPVVTSVKYITNTLRNIRST